MSRREGVTLLQGTSRAHDNDKIEWNKEYSKVLDELNDRRGKLRLLTRPVPDESLYMYLAVVQ